MMINFVIVVDRVELMTSPTEDQSKLLASLAKIKLFGESNFASAVQIAQLSLKYRRNMNGGKRIIVFVGSPLSTTIADLEKIAKSLKKNAIAIDVVSMGECETNQEKLTAFVNTANAEENSHLINVPPGVLPSDAIMSTPILMMQHNFGGGRSDVDGFSGGDNNFEEFGGVDPSLDPDVAMAIRASLEEAREREEARTATNDGVPNSNEGEQTLQEDTHVAFPSFSDAESDDALLQRALEMSLRDSTPSATSDQIPNDPPVTADATTTVKGDDASASDKHTKHHGGHHHKHHHHPEKKESESDISGQTERPDHSGEHTKHHGGHHHKHHHHNQEKKESESNISGQTERPDQTFLDSGFINELLGSVEVDRDDPMVQAALAQMGVNREDEENGTQKDSTVNKKRKGDGDEKEG